jgi:hypothetical protein
MHARLLTLTLLAAAAAGLAPRPAHAQSSTYALQSDLYYDFDVYAADPDPRSGYFLVIVYADGSEEEFGPYTSRSSAEYSLFFMVEHNQIPGAVDSRIESRELPPTWVFMQRFDRHADAIAYADLLESVGLLTEVRSVWALKLQVKTPSSFIPTQLGGR